MEAGCTLKTFHHSDFSCQCLYKLYYALPGSSRDCHNDSASHSTSIVVTVVIKAIVNTRQCDPNQLSAVTVRATESKS